MANEPDPMKKNRIADYPFPLDEPPPFHYKLLDYGERPYWTPDGKRIAFVNSNYGDICEIDFETRKVRNLTENLGDHHSFLRVLILPNGDYLLIGPKEFKDRYTSRRVESELWIMDKDAKTPPKPLGKRLFEGIGVSRFANKITYSVNGNHDPAVGGPGDFEARVADIVYDADGPRLVNEKVIYTSTGDFDPEPQDFRNNDTEVIMAEYHEPKGEREEWYCAVKGVNIETGEVKLYISEPHIHNECEGIFPDEQYICLECSRDFPDKGTTDLWKLKLDESMERCRMTRMIDRYPWRATNSNVSPDGKWLAFMLNILGSEPGYGMGLGLVDLEAWGKSEYAHQWEKPKAW
jgi:Tol biopolymer transport system component